MKYCDTCHSTYPTDFSVCPKDQSALREAEELQPGMVLRGKYEILEKIGAGGMASVYRAKHLTFDEVRAIKVVSNELARDEKFLKRFKNEAIIARKLRHPNAVRIDDFDTTDDGRPFIVMDYVEGQSLRQVLHQEGALPALRAVRIARQVAAALDAAHRLGIVHRDVKPDNILIVPMPTKSEYGSDIAKVLDFGIATVRDGGPIAGSGYTPTQTSVVVGTPQYISPEQAMGKPGSELDGRADLYSLGAVLYEMLTGMPPFDSDTPIGVLLQHLQAQAKPPHERCPELNIPPEVSKLVMKALEKDPAGRFQTADEMTRALSDPASWGETVVLGSGGLATPPAGPKTEEPKVQTAPPAVGPARPPEDAVDLVFTASSPGSREERSGREPGLMHNSDFAGVDFDAMLQRQEPVGADEPPAPPAPKPAFTVAPPAAAAARPAPTPPPKPAAAAKPAPPSPPRLTPTPPPAPAAAMQAKTARPASASKVKTGETVFEERKPKAPALSLPAWAPIAGVVALAALLIVVGGLFAWRHSRSAVPATPAAAAGAIPTRPDALILQDVKDALRNTPGLRRAPIEASVQGGVVTLTGRVLRPNVPAMAQAVAAAVPGVTQVDNQIEVVGGAAPQSTLAGQGAGSAAADAPAAPAPRRPAPFGGAGQETQPVPGALPSATDQGIGVQQMRIQQAIDIGNYRLSQGDYAGAAQAFRRALALDPNNAAARQGLRRAEQGR